MGLVEDFEPRSLQLFECVTGLPFVDIGRQRAQALREKSPAKEGSESSGGDGSTNSGGSGSSRSSREQLHKRIRGSELLMKILQPDMELYKLAKRLFRNQTAACGIAALEKN